MATTRTTTDRTSQANGTNPGPRKRSRQPMDDDRFGEFLFGSDILNAIFGGASPLVVGMVATPYEATPEETAQVEAAKAEFLEKLAAIFPNHHVDPMLSIGLIAKEVDGQSDDDAQPEERCACGLMPTALCPRNQQPTT